MTQPLQRFPITIDEIDRLVAVFYGEIRKHPVLGPIFHNQIGTEAQVWRDHEAKIASFWRNAILIDRDYQGNPMRKHMEVKAIKPHHFDQWLALFETVAKAELDTQTAQSIISLAHRIGRGLRYGIEHGHQNAGSPPSLK